MKRKYHIFITIKYFDVCGDYGLFGVSEAGMKWGVNQLANVNKGDIAFFFTKKSVGKRTKGVVYGPFEVISNPFFNDTVVWSNKADGKDPYSYRVKIKAIPSHFCKRPIPVQRIYDLREEYKIKSVLDTSSFGERSVCNLFEEEGRLILEMLLQNNFEDHDDTSSYKGHTLEEHTFDFFQSGRVKSYGDGYLFKRESYLEAFLLRNKEVLEGVLGIDKGTKNIGVDVYNQIGTYIAGGNIDILTVLKETLLGTEFVVGANVVELKNRPLERDDVVQLTEYIEWAQRILPRCKREMIHGILVGAKDLRRSTRKIEEFMQQLSKAGNLYNIEAYTYQLLSDMTFEYEKLVYRCAFCGQSFEDEDPFILEEDVEDWDDHANKKVVIKAGEAVCGECLTDYIGDTERIPKTSPQIKYMSAGVT